MISIVVCSNNNNLYEQVANSISETIGADHEIVRIDNVANNLGICDAYNIGAAKAKFPYLCFIHEDILFKTANWGAQLIDIFKNDAKVGIIGIAGSKYVSLSPGQWPSNDNELDCYNIIQHYPAENKISARINNPENGVAYVEVKGLDGVFLFSTKKIWEQHQFDGETFKGFHCYDIDFCLNVGKTYKLLVAYNLSIEHFSPGNLSKEWIMQAIQLSEKWKDHLPVGALPKQKMKMIEWHKKRYFFLIMLIYGCSLNEALKVMFDFGYLKFFYLRGNFSFAVEIFKSKTKKIFNTQLRPVAKNE